MPDANNLSIIEQAAKRLAELKRAGIEAPDASTATLDRSIETVPTTQGATP